jgi:predicted NUDIX family NTP pyrophosphohydrolase
MMLLGLDWPPRSGDEKKFPEVDWAAWFTIDEAKQKILKGQLSLLEELRRKQTGG